MGTTSRRAIARQNGAAGSLEELMARYPDEESCERRLIEAEHPGGWRCPRCGNDRCSRVRGRGHEWQCTRCSRQFSVTSGTVMQSTHLPLRTWFLAMWLLSNTRRGVSALELARMAGCGERSAGYLLRRLRAAMARSECVQPALR